MNTRTYRTSNGKLLDVSTLMAQNEEVIAVGNIYVNARGDELGAGGKIIRTRNEIMEEHYKLSEAAKSTIQPTSRTAAEKEALAKTMNNVQSNDTITFPDAADPDISDEEIAKQKKGKK